MSGVKANDLAIKALKPRTVPYEVAVREHRGLVIRVHPSGERTFLYRYRQDGALKRVSLKSSTLADARAEWNTQSAAKKSGDDPAELARVHRASKQLKRTEQRAAPTIATLAADYVEKYAKVHKRSWREDERMLEIYVLPEWGSLKARDIARRDVIALVGDIATKPRKRTANRADAPKGAPIAANRVLAVVRKMFNWAVERDVLATSPCIGVKPPGAEKSRERVLTDAELRAFWTGLADSGLRALECDALRLQLLTGARIGEVVGARWEEFDLAKGEWLVPGNRSKNGREALVPLSPAAVAIVGALPRAPGASQVFPWPGASGHIRIDTITTNLREAVATMDMDRFTSHDLRRTAATKLAQLGASRTVIDAVLNHVDRSVGGIYDRHTYAAEKRAALETWARHLESLIDPEASRNVVSIKPKSGKRR